MELTDFTRYMVWLAIGRRQICGGDTGGNCRDMCVSCEEEINREAETQEVA